MATLENLIAKLEENAAKRLEAQIETAKHDYQEGMNDCKNGEGIIKECHDAYRLRVAYCPRYARGTIHLLELPALLPPAPVCPLVAPAGH